MNSILRPQRGITQPSPQPYLTCLERARASGHPPWLFEGRPGRGFAHAFPLREMFCVRPLARSLGSTPSPSSSLGTRGFRPCVPQTDWVSARSQSELTDASGSIEADEMANVSDIVKVGTGKETGICSLREPYLFHSFKKQRDEFCHATTPPFERISLSPVLLYMY